MSESFEDWIDTQYRAAAQHLLRSVSPTGLVKQRPGFGQTVRAVRGAIVASPVLADWDPDPDYFFHWFRDSALVVDALRVLYEDGTLGNEALTQVQDFVRFSLSLHALDGRKTCVPREATQPGFRQYLREAPDWRAVHGERIDADTRVNADGTLDFTKWTRPQHDGPALRALAISRWLRVADLGAAAEQLLRSDLAFVWRHAGQPAYDIWEEDLGWHWYTLRVSVAALESGAAYWATRGRPGAAQPEGNVAHGLRRRLAQFEIDPATPLRSRRLLSGERSSKELDSSIILGAIHAQDVSDPRLRTTLDQLDAHFASRYALNRGRRRGYALGRYPGDVYHGGNPWFLCTLAAAEFCYRAAQGDTGGCARGDAYLATVREFVPRGGAMSEQFDADTGSPVSARHLAWSYAALISCVDARRQALAR